MGIAIIIIALIAKEVFSVKNTNEKKDITNENGCKIVAVGHFYSLQMYPDLQEIFINEMIEKHGDMSTLVFLGDNTISGSMAELVAFRKLIDRIDVPKFFAPGNHDFRTRDAYDNWVEAIGYTSGQTKINNCNLLFLNTVSPEKIDFNDVEMVKGAGLDDGSIQILKDLERVPGVKNLIFMHHSLHSIGLIHPDDEWNSELNRIYENEKNWREEIQPIIKGKVDAVFVGDLANSAISRIIIDNIPYIGNSMSSGFDPNPTTSRRPISYTVIEVKNGEIEVEIDYLPIPIKSSWFNFDRDHRYRIFRNDYDDNYDRKGYAYP